MAQIVLLGALALTLAAVVPAPAYAAGPTAGAVSAATQRSDAALAAMVAFDATFIPALAGTSAATQDHSAAASARIAAQSLASGWPALRTRLAAAWPDAPADWQAALDAVGTHVEAGWQAAQRTDWSAAHDTLEEVRPILLRARRARGMDYFVDRLTEFHARMEVLAGAAREPVDLGPEGRAALKRVLAEADALWTGVEQFPLAASAYGLTTERKSQVDHGIAQERAALEALQTALATGDDARVRQAAAGVKAPFARVFTAFGARGDRGQP